MDGAPDLAATLGQLLAAGHRGIGISTREERRALELIERTAADLGLEVHTYSVASGADRDGDEAPALAHLRRLLRSREEEVWVLLDADRWARGEVERRALRELAAREHGPTCVVVGTSGPASLDVPELRWTVLPLPGRAELETHVRWVGQMLEDGGEAGAAAKLDEAAPRLAAAGLGLEMFALEQLMAEAIARHGADPDAIHDHVKRAKGALLDAAGLFESVDPVPMEEVGGLDQYKAWLERRKLALDPGARLAGIPDPRGVLLVGVQGCGKSLAARATASALGLPLFRVDPGRLFAGLVGESEANLRMLLATAERMAPVVLWLDEIDKSLAGIDGARSDAGTSARIMGGLLTWLQERTSPVFVVATANRVDALPPELLRRGRLDELFFVDLPRAPSRRAIAQVHLEQRPRRQLGHVPPLDGSLDAFMDVAAQAEGFSGAELEAAIVEARLDAFASQRPLHPGDLARAIAATVPLSTARAEDIAALRAWARDRARPADDSTDHVSDVSTGGV